MICSQMAVDCGRLSSTGGSLSLSTLLSSSDDCGVFCGFCYLLVMWWGLDFVASWGGRLLRLPTSSGLVSGMIFNFAVTPVTVDWYPILSSGCLKPSGLL